MSTFPCLTSNTVGFAVLASAATAIGAAALRWHISRQTEKAEKVIEQDGLHSIIAQFQTFALKHGTTVEEANKRRTTNYYEKARQAHNYRSIRGCNASMMLQKRHAFIENAMKYYIEGKKSHRTVLIMCDDNTSSLLNQVRRDILRPLQSCTSIRTEGCWIPDVCMVPQEDMHVTVATPWWWHNMLQPAGEN